MGRQDIGTLIVGAGPAGLAAAMELADAEGDFTVLEKDAAVGGLAKTYRFEENGLVFRADNGPHRFFSKNPFLYRFIEGLIGERWIEVKRQTRQYIGGKFYDYPVNPAQALANIGPRKAARIVADYAAARFRYGFLGRPIGNFEDHIVAHFGRTLGEFNMLNYTEKIWGVPPRTIHADWATQRIRGLSVGFLAKAAIARISGAMRTKPLRTLADSFWYPESGSGLVYETIARKLADGGRPVRCGSYPTKIRHAEGRVLEIEALVGGKTAVFRPRSVIQSVPPQELLKLLDPPPPGDIMEKASRMRYRDQAYLFITFDRDRITDDQWIYFPEKNIPFGRVSEMKNFSPKMSPPGKTSLLIEFFCFEGDDIWNMGKDELATLAIGHLERLGFCKAGEVRHTYLIRQKRVYPIYDTAYAEYVRAVMGYLDGFANLYSVGRPGRFRYNNQDHSLEMGMMAARSAMAGTPCDLDSVGTERAYFEGKTRGESRETV